MDGTAAADACPAKDEKVAVDADAAEELIDDGQLLLAANELRNRMGDDFRRFLKQVFRDPKLTQSDAHRLLLELRPLASILTTNYDKLIEAAYPGAPCVYNLIGFRCARP